MQTSSRLLESLEGLKPAGSGRVDTQAKELRYEAERLREALADAERRNIEICRRARHTRSNHADQLWGELQRLQTPAAARRDPFLTSTATIPEETESQVTGTRWSDAQRARPPAAAAPEASARTSKDVESDAAAGAAAWPFGSHFHPRSEEAMPSVRSGPRGSTNTSSGMNYMSSRSESVRVVEPLNEPPRILNRQMSTEGLAAEPLVTDEKLPASAWAEAPSSSALAGLALDVTEPLDSAVAEPATTWAGSDIPASEPTDTEPLLMASLYGDVSDTRSPTAEAHSQATPISPISRSTTGVTQVRVVETIRSASPVPALLRDTAMPPMATVKPSIVQPAVVVTLAATPLPDVSTGSLAASSPPPASSPSPSQRGTVETAVSSQQTPPAAVGPATQRGTAERSAGRRTRVARPSPLQTRPPPQSRQSAGGLSPPKRAPLSKLAPTSPPKQAPSPKRAASPTRAPTPKRAPSPKRTLSPKQSSGSPKAKRKIPTPDALRKAFMALDRNFTGWLTKAMLIEGIEEPKLRSVLTMVFGKPFLEQSSEDLQEDLDYVFGLLDEDNAGEVSIPDFITKMQRLAAKMHPLEPESPMLAPSNKTRWNRLIRNWRRKLAHTGLKIPLFSLRRCARHVDAGGDAATLAAELSRQAALLEACDWWALTPSELIEATTSLWRVVPAVRVDGSTTATSSDGGRLLQAASTLRATVLGRLDELDAAELTVACIVLLRAPVMPGSEVQAAVEQRGLARTLAGRLEGLSLAQISEVASTFDELGRCEVEFLEAAVHCIVERCGQHELVALCRPNELANALWLSAKYLQEVASSNAKAPGSSSTPLAAEQALPISRAASAIMAGVAGYGAALDDAGLARLVWSLGHLGECPPRAFLAELGYQAVLRARRLSARDLTRVTWGLAVMGHTPQGVKVIVEAAAHAVAQAELDERMEGPELAHLTGALGTWAVGDPDMLRPIWEVLRRRVADFTGDELLMVMCATVRLGMRDDVLVSTAQARALCVGPYDPAGVKDFMQCLVEYWCCWKSDQLRELAASYAVQAVRHGARVDLLDTCLGPAPSFAGVGAHARSDRLLNAQRAACVRG